MPNALTPSPLVRPLAAALISIAATAPSFAQTRFAQAQITPQMRSEAMSLMQICRGDYDRLCSGIMPGGGRILACLENRSSLLSPACAQAMPRAEALKDSAVAGGVMPK